MSTVSTPPPAAPFAAALAADFPGWLPPMLVKELRQSLRAKGFVGAFLAFHALTALVFWWTIEINSASGLRETFTWLNGVFWGLLNVVLLIVVPLRGLGALRTEMDNRTLDLLVLTRMSAWRIVTGKWIAVVAQASLFLVALLPYGVVRYFFGSVDLASDLAQAGWLFLVSCGLAAATIWVSGMPKLLRVVLPIFLVIAVQSLGMAATLGAIFSSSARTGGAAMRSPLLEFGWTHFAVIVLLAVTFLALAVRRIAPAAENHSAWARGFAFVLFAGSVALVMLLRGFGAENLLAVGFVAIVVVAVVELARDRLPMGSHWRPWRGRGRVRAAVGRLLLPGWPSAALFAAVMLGLMALATSLSPQFNKPGSSPLRDMWVISALAWQALVFPALLLSFLPTTSAMRMGGSGYFVLQGLFGTISLLSANNTANFLAGENFARALNWLCQVLPISSFWLGTATTDGAGRGFSVVQLAGQTLVLGVLVWLTWRQSRPYWRQLAVLEARAQAAAPASVSATKS